MRLLQEDEAGARDRYLTRCCLLCIIRLFLVTFGLVVVECLIMCGFSGVSCLLALLAKVQQSS